MALCLALVSRSSAQGPCSPLRVTVPSRNGGPWRGTAGASPPQAKTRRLASPPSRFGACSWAARARRTPWPPARRHRRREQEHMCDGERRSM
eukprot:3508534-Prymnesium_polylepis.1